MKYDVVIKSHPKDYLKLKYVIDSVKYLIPQPEGIYLVTPDRYVPPGYGAIVTPVMDKDVLPTIDRNRLKYRPNWFWQMMAGMFQTFTPNEYWLDLNSDRFFLKELNLFDELNNPIFFISSSHPQHHQPYFAFNQKVFGLEDRAVLGGKYGLGWNDSFVIDFMMYKKSIVKEMLDVYGGIDGFFDKCCEVINTDCNLGDYELYPSWCMTHHPNLYTIQTGVQTRITGKDDPDIYTEAEIVHEIEISKLNKELIALSCHSWKMDYPV